jgi:ATP-dependent Clp protease ATP-binding subunit ClpA
MIVDKTMGEINDMLKEKNVTIVLSDEAKLWLRERGYVPEMGARPLQRVVNDNIKKPLSKEILFGRLTDGGTVTVDINAEDGIEFAYT